MYLYCLEERPGRLFPSGGFGPSVNTRQALNKENLLHGANCNIIRVVLMAGERSYFLKESVVRGRHVYKHIWTPGISEELSVEKEPGNLHDNIAVFVVKKDYPVGHVPQSLSKVMWFFLTRGGTDSCRTMMMPAHSAQHAP